ncbi:MAG TPA: PQQ-binding-like beta-propeller repeat protein [Gammaproteobacteria bacterium]|nr:PQQ-binding-like beta-propeller repeat protein [Gammaproteobacteria bacterium]
MPSTHAPRLAAASALAGLVACSPGSSEPPSSTPAPIAEYLAAGDWPSYNRDLAGTRFSPLTQIDTSNVADLRQAWVYPLGRNSTTGSLTGGSEATPLAIGGTLFVTAADRVVALRADTGQEVWRYSLDHGSPSRRGLAYWPGERRVPARVFFTSGRRLIALDAATGRRVTGFGAGGEIEMPAVYNAAPTRFENLLIVGSNTPPGGVRAFDARTGADVWVFDSVPQPDEPGHETWGKPAARDRASVLGWSFSFTLDADRALLYASLAGPSPDDTFGGDRPGDNLYANSVVALDARTGERRWHFQTVHHDVWDYDLPAPPALLDVAIGGATVPVLAQPGKSGYLYVLNRVTGVPVFGVEERPAPASDVPGERTAATQPIPLKPGPIARVAYAADDLVTREETSAAHAEFCRMLRERGGGLQNSGPFTPYRFRAEARPRTTLVFPGSLGGANWGGAAADPALGLVFVNTSDVGSLGWIEAPRDDAAAGADEAGAEGAPYRRTSAVGGPFARFWWSDAQPDSGGNELTASERAWPCQKPPWGQLVAVNVATGEIAWQTPLGITEQLPEAKQHTGRVNLGGPIVTAGGLVFIGATNDRRFRAFGSRTGLELWAAKLELNAHAVPITYLGRDAKQYVAIVAAGASEIDGEDMPDAQALVAFALPTPSRR